MLLETGFCLDVLFFNWNEVVWSYFNKTIVSLYSFRSGWLWQMLSSAFKMFFFFKKGSFMNEWTKIDQLNTRQKLNTQLHQPKLLDPTAISSCNTKIWNGMESNIVLLFKFGKNWWPSLLISSFLIIFLFLSYPLCKSSLFNISF